MPRRLLCKLVLRLLLLAAALAIFFVDAERLDFTTVFQEGLDGLFLWFVWLIFVFDMLYRILPNKSIAIGARKHFSCSYTAAEPGHEMHDRPAILRQLNKGAFLSALAWLAITAVIVFLLFRFGLLTAAAVLVLMLLYSVTDLVFILFFCPFQLFFMKNRCCTVCRIYNWDYFMFCAPLLFFWSFFSISLLLFSLAVLFSWELSLRKNPHFFIRETNENLHCSRCEDRACKRFLKGSFNV